MSLVVTYIVIAVLILLIPGALMALSSHRHKRHPIAVPPISAFALVDTPLCPSGSVLIDGELWLARSANESLIQANTRVVVVGLQDHWLVVTAV